MLLTPLDILALAASSQPAVKAERERVVATLQALRSSLACVIAGSATPDAKASRAQFSNAASDLFCQARLIASAHNVSYAGVSNVEAQVEELLRLFGRNAPYEREAGCLLGALDAELAKLNEQAALPSSGTSKQSAA